MVIEKIKVADLSEDPANARKHSERNIAAIVSSLRRFGQQKPIVIDKSNVVRAGNGTLQAAMQLGWETVACVRTELMGGEPTAYGIADNRTSELAEWDESVLSALLQGIVIEDEDLLIATGFDESDMEKLIGAEVLDNDSEYVGMPEFENDEVKEVCLIVYFASDEDKEQFSVKVCQAVSKQTRFVWYPKEAKPVRQSVENLIAE